ncbi:hypothetical protein [Nguyenibacter sp. L1]|nr:hypothetical protein [Nguyenibacter sp. L1]WRH88900.1 hypothetical protein QN315_04555 [Nguyenibacter sp. L1]
MMMMTPPRRPDASILGPALACAVLGGGGALLGWLLDPADFAGAWLGALLLWIMWSLGSMALLLAHALTGGRWGHALRPALRDAVAALPLLLPPLLVPLLLNLSPLYRWARPEAGAEAGAALRNGGWLNAPFFSARVVAYALLWSVLSAMIVRRLRAGASVASIAGPMLFALAVSFTLAMFDLAMSLEDFTSGIYGMLCAADAAILALSVATASSPERIGGAVRDDLGRLLLALTVLWAYLAFCQLLVVWQSNLAGDAGWYLRRLTPFWTGMGVALAVLRFAVPFFVLLWPAARRRARVLRGICVLTAATTVLHVWWLVLPALGRRPDGLDAACLLAFGGVTALAWLYYRPPAHPTRAGGGA